MACIPVAVVAIAGTVCESGFAVGTDDFAPDAVGACGGDRGRSGMDVGGSYRGGTYFKSTAIGCRTGVGGRTGESVFVGEGDRAAKRGLGTGGGDAEREPGTAGSGSDSDERAVPKESSSGVFSCGVGVVGDSGSATPSSRSSRFQR